MKKNLVRCRDVRAAVELRLFRVARRRDRREAVGPEVGVVPVRVREVEIDFDVVTSSGGDEFRDHVAAERRFDDAVGAVAGLDLRTSRGSPVHAPGDARLRVEHREAVVVLRGEGEHAQAVVVEQLHPLLGVEAGGVPRLVSLLILLLLVERQLKERPRLAAGETLRVEAPVDADAVLDVLECLHRGGRRMFVVGLRYRLHVVLDRSVMRVGRRQADAVVWCLPDVRRPEL